MARGREHSILGGAAYRPRARKPLWPCVGAALAPVTCLCVLISLREMRCECAKIASFLWLAPRDRRSREAISYRGRRAKKPANFERAKSCFDLVYLVLLHLLGAPVTVICISQHVAPVSLTDHLPPTPVPHTPGRSALSTRKLAWAPSRQRCSSPRARGWRRRPAPPRSRATCPSIAPCACARALGWPGLERSRQRPAHGSA